MFETEGKEIKLSVPVDVEQETVWLNRIQMADLFDRDVKTIGKHINNALKEELDAYPTLEERAVHLLCFVTKNHIFLEENKRISVAMFLYFLDKIGHCL